MENNEGNAEIMGVVLLIAIFVGAITLMGVMMLSAPQPEKVPAVAFDFWSDENNTSVSLIHRGGETLNLNGTVLRVIYSNGTTSENPSVIIDGGTPDYWTHISSSSSSSPYSIGDVINLTAPAGSIDQVQLIWPGTGGASMTGGGGPVLLGAWSTNSSSGKNPPAAVTGAVPITFPYPSEGPTRAQPTQTPAVPWVYFIANITATNGMVPINFTNLTENQGPYGLLWSFGDNSTSTDQSKSVIHSFSDPDPATFPSPYFKKYTVTLTLTNSSDGTNTSYSLSRPEYITVYQRPIAQFTPVLTEGNAPFNVSFNDSSTGYIDRWTWDFGDEEPGYTPGTSWHIYNTARNYSVNLTVANPYEANSWGYQFITVHPQVIANFTATPMTGPAPLTVFFNGSGSQGYNLNYTWDFGDGNTFTSQDATYSYTYTTPGTYTANLTVNNTLPGPNTSTSINRTITVTNPTPTELVASFNATPTVGNSQFLVRFDDTSTGNPTSWNWSFGDGLVSEEQNPSHPYTTPYTNSTTYTVTLIVTNNAGLSSSATKTITVYPPLAARILTEPAPPEGNANLTVRFQDNSTGEVVGNVSRVWTFGDGTTFISDGTIDSGLTLVHSYPKNGTYIVNLTIDNGFGTSSTAHTTVTVHQPLNASFNATPPRGNLPLTVQFNDTSTGDNITAWSWNFGDDTTSIVRNATHTYTAAGNYTVTLTVSNPPWGTSTTNRTVTVIAPLHAGFSAVTTATSEGGGLQAPRTVQFTDTSIGSPTNWSWTFGDGGTSTDRNPIHTYNTAGTYTVTLTISNLNNSDSTSETISVITTKNHTISGIVYNDLNKNGDPTGQPGLSGWTVILNKQGSTVTTTTTGADGSYMFTGLEKNKIYVVSLGLPSGWQYTTPSTGSYSDGLNGNQDSPNTNFGVFQAPLSGNVVLNANRPGYLVAGTYLQFRFLKGQYDPQGTILINGNTISLNSNDMVKIVLETNQSGKIGTNPGTISNIYKLNFQDVTLNITRNGVPLAPLRGAITGVSINSFDQFQSTLGVTVPYISASTALSVGGNTIISSYNSPYDTRNIQLTNVTRQLSDGPFNMEIGSTSKIDTGSVESCQLIP